MRLSKLFTKTRKSVPSDETAKNAQLLIQAGFIHKEMAGVYSYLPLGQKVLENIKTIIRDEMNSLGAQELLMSSMQRKEIWEQTDRWDDNKVDIWFKSKLKNGTEIGFGWTHEEPISVMMKEFVSSYRDLPTNVYEFQNKLRNETRAKSGIMRGREFTMKDLYSYSATEEEHQKFYEAVTKSYLNIFEKVGLGNRTFLTLASGGDFTEFSHEFQTITDAGEDTIYLDKSNKIAINDEVMSDDVIKKAGADKDKLEKVKAAEVGNIFNFGEAKSKELGLNFTDENGKEKPVILGSYGIGVSRLMGVIAECFADDKGLVWPENIAPAKVYLVRIGDSEPTVKHADELYKELEKQGVTTIYDDRDLRPGEKFADADLMGIPHRIVVSDKTVEAKVVEYKARTKTDSEMLSKEEVLKRLVIKD